MMRVMLGSCKVGRVCVLSVATFAILLLVGLLLVGELTHQEGASEAGIQAIVFPNASRKLLQSEDGRDTNRIGTGCSKNDIAIYQGTTAPLPSGIPSYIVQIMNMCVSDCRIADIHIQCGWFSSACLVNPKVFRRLRYNDCLVNKGEPLGPGESLSFQYANTFRYPLSVSSVVCC